MPGDPNATDVEQRGVSHRLRDGRGGSIHSVLSHRSAMDAVFTARTLTPHTGQPTTAVYLLHHLHIPGRALLLHAPRRSRYRHTIHSSGRPSVLCIHQVAE